MFILFKIGIQVLQNQRPRTNPLNNIVPIPEEVTIRQRPRITIDSNQIQTQLKGKGPSSTSRQSYRDPAQTQPPATTYRPTATFLSQKTIPSFTTTTRKPVDFSIEFQKFQQDTATTTSKTPNLKLYHPHLQKFELQNATPNPIYDTQLVFDPSTGQIDSSLFPQNIAYRIPASLVSPQQQTFDPSPQIVPIDQPVYQRPLQVNIPTTRSSLPFPQFSQQVIGYQTFHLLKLNIYNLHKEK